MQFTIIHLQYFSFNSLLGLRQRLFRSLVRLQIDFHELFEQFISRNQSKSQSKNQSKNQSGARNEITK